MCVLVWRRCALRAPNAVVLPKVYGCKLRARSMGHARARASQPYLRVKLYYDIACPLARRYPRNISTKLKLYCAVVAVLFL